MVVTKFSPNSQIKENGEDPRSIYSSSTKNKELTRRGKIEGVPGCSDRHLSLKITEKLLSSGPFGTAQNEWVERIQLARCSPRVHGQERQGFKVFGHQH